MRSFFVGERILCFNRKVAMPRYYLTKLAAEQHSQAVDYAREFLFNVLNIGEEMLSSGAEVSRVEDSIRRMCTAYGAERTDVFVISSVIIATVYSPVYGAISQTRRIKSTRYDLYKLSKLNALSRRICSDMPLFDEVEKELDDICTKLPHYSETGIVAMYALISFSFSLFFGGSLLDAMASGVIGVYLRCMDYVSRVLDLPATIAAVLWSFTGGCLAMFFVYLDFGHSPEYISVGNVMLLIPGMLLTNSIRDMFSGDILSALLGFCNAFLLATLIAFGFALPTYIW